MHTVFHRAYIYVYIYIHSMTYVTYIYMNALRTDLMVMVLRDYFWLSTMFRDHSQGCSGNYVVLGIKHQASSMQGMHTNPLSYPYGLVTIS